VTDFSQMWRWNSKLVRGLAQSVLERARAIRMTLGSEAPRENEEGSPGVNGKSMKKSGERRGGAKRAKPRIRRRLRS